MDTPDLHALLDRLDGEPADAIESETVECMSWDLKPEARDRLNREIRERVICLANALGGVIILGVSDRKRTRREAIHGVGSLDPNAIRKMIYDGTAPHILVDIEELNEPEGRLLALRVPRGLPPHTTSEGTGKIRVGKECRPLLGPELARLMVQGGQIDLSAQSVPGAAPSDLDPDQIRILRRTIESEAHKPELARIPDPELLGDLRLTRGNDVTLAAVLLLGRPEALARYIPQHEVIFLRFEKGTSYKARQDLKGPLLAILDQLQRILEANMRLERAQTSGFAQLELPDMTWWAARESILNALVHRDYFLRQAVTVESFPDRLQISSPGGFLGGITPDNILRHPPHHRNPLLTSVLQAIGLVNRVGMGVDLIFEELLRLGKAVPRYSADEGHVRLVLPTRTHKEFALFVAEEGKAGRALSLDELILLRALIARGFLDRWTAAQRLQLPDEGAAESLAALRRKGYLVAQGRGRGTSYRLARALSDRLRGREENDFEVSLDDEAVRLRIQAILGERGTITNADVRRLSGGSRMEAVRLMRDLCARGVARLVGRGRAAHYERGKSFVRAGKTGGSRPASSRR
jgi:ATP-dependent DNA helicase RecG